MEKIVRLGDFSAVNGYQAIVTDQDEYAGTFSGPGEDYVYESRSITLKGLWRRCSDNARGRIVTHPEGIDFIEVQS